VRRIGLGEACALAAGLAVFAYLGWDGALWDARLQLVLHLLAVAALGGLVALHRRGVALPRTRLDPFILALLAAFGLSTLTAQNRGLALPALAGILVTAGMLPVALLALRRRPTATALAVLTPILALAAWTLLSMLARRVGWYQAGAVTLFPPVRLGNENTVFGSVAVAPFVLLAALPLSGFLEPARLRRAVVMVIGAIGLPLALLSGSRSAWLAIGIAAIVLAMPLARRLRPRRRWGPRELGAAGAVLVAAMLGVAFAWPRITAVTSLVYRTELWRDTLLAWIANPMLGIGPGTMPYARQAAAPPLTFPVHQPHSHDLLLGVLGDAGIVGLLAAMALVAAFVITAGPWRTRTARGRAAFAVLAGFAVAGLFEDLTFLPNMNLLLIGLAAVALADAGAVTWHRARMPRPLAAGGALATGGLLLAMIFSDAAAIAYRSGADAAGAYDWPEAQAGLARAVALDPWHPIGPKALAIAADGNRDRVAERNALDAAVRRNPGDGASWTNLGIVCLQLRDTTCARDAAQRAVETASVSGHELINAALLFSRLGDQARADAAYRLSLLTNLNTSLATSWPRRIALDEGTQPITEQVTAQTTELDILVSRAAAHAPIEPSRYADPAVHALALAVAGRQAESSAALDRALSSRPDDLLGWDLAVLLRTHWGEDATSARAVGAVLRGSPLATEPPKGPSLSYDIGSFRAIPRDGLVADAERLQPPLPWPWSLDRLLPPAR